MKCRICNTEIKKCFLSLGNMPLSNSLVEDPSNIELYYPLDLYLCQKCNFVQIPELEDAKNIFSEGYPYFSSYSETWLAHCKKYVEMIYDKYLLNKEHPSVIEIGSNDGALLQYFKLYPHIKILGIEPAKEAAKHAISQKHIPTDMKYFDTEYVKQYLRHNNKVYLIIGNNVLAHNPNLHDFVEALSNILKEDGIITLEFPWLLNLIRKNQFDTIYHEHFSYFSLFAARKLFQKHNLQVFDAEEISTHGGSLRIYIKHINDKTKNHSESVSYLLKKETELYNIKIYADFSDKIKVIKRNLLKLLINIKDENKTIVAYTSPAKGNTLLNYCGIGTDFIEYSTDNNPYKQGKFLPGTHIPIYHSSKIEEDKPDYLLILAWNIAEELINQLKYTEKWDCKFIIPIPEPTIVDIKE